MSPSKTYNLAGLECGYAVIKNPELRKNWKDFSYGMIPGVNIAGHVAALAALNEAGSGWNKRWNTCKEIAMTFSNMFMSRFRRSG